MFINKRIKSIKTKVRNFASNEFKTKLDISVCDKSTPMINSACHYNAVHNVKNGKSVVVIECVVINDDDCTAHYINLNSDGAIVDYTLGWCWSGCDYRLVRYVHENEYDKISKSLSKLKDRLCGRFISKLDKLMGIDPFDIC